jgi:hypothetical protein
MCIWLLGTAFAQEVHRSEPADLLFADSLDLFGFVSIDTGYLPSQSDPISVRFHVTPSGGVVTEMEATSGLEWPTAFKHSLEAIPGEGLFGVDTSVEIEFEVHINVASVYQNSLSLWSEQLDIAKTVAFDTLVLPGSPEYPLEVAVDNTGLIDPFEYGFDVVPGVAGLDFQVQIYPQMLTTMGGNRIETVLGSSMGSQTGEGSFAQLDPPAGNPGEVFLQSTYFADLSTVFGLVIEPSATLDTIVGDFELAAFEIPIDVLTNTETRSFAPAVYLHPLPALDPLDLPTDLGGVDVGDLANLEVPLTNLGVLGLEGTAHIEGGDAFSVYPQYFYATEANTDGVVVTFAPLEAGEHLATLVITSNDPVTPVLRVPITGTGIPLATIDGPPPPDNGNVSGEDVRTCGCSPIGGSSMGFGALWLLVPGLLVVRRRRDVGAIARFR